MEIAPNIHRIPCLHAEQKLLDFAKSQVTFTLKEAIGLVASWLEDGSGLLTFPFNGNLQRLTQRGLLVEGCNSDNLVPGSVPA